MHRAISRLPIVAAVLTTLAVSGAIAAPRSTRPAFVSYRSPNGIGDDAGEPTLGVHPKTGAVLFASGSRVLRVTGMNGRGGATWKDVSPLVPGLRTFDPILELDEKTGRVFTSQLDLYCSRMAYSDDAGDSWTQVPLGCGVGTLFDHQSVGVAKVRGAHDPDDYPNLVYYCAQTGATGMCATSADGGYTYGAAVPTYSLTQCTTLHGHLKGAPDGTAYLPPYDCGGNAAVARSLDDGKTWTVHKVPGSTVGDALHPSVGVGSDGTAYLGWGSDDGDGPGGAPYVAVSRDRGDHWTKPYRLGREVGIANTRFVTVVAGDGDRAAVAYLGSRTPGNSSDPAYTGAWHLYVSFTYDRGKTWQTVNATLASPVQVGPICTEGAMCTADRNLLDFNDVVVDGRGRVVVAFADGCAAATCTTANREAKATIARQESGRGLLRKYDGR